MNARFRPASNDDIPFVRDLVYTVLREYGLTPDPETTDADLEDLEGHYFQRGGRFDLLEVEEEGVFRVVGTVGLWPVEGEEKMVELRKMYLLPLWRGQQLGKMMLEHAILEAQLLKFERMTLETASSLTEAIQLYESFGFQPWEPAHLAARCDHAMVRDL